MPHPNQSAVEFAIKQFARKDNPSLLDWDNVKTMSQIQVRLVEYEATGRGMNFDEL